jgi:hypothetical protein
VSLQSGVGLPGNEPPLDFIEKDREDQAENRDIQQADIDGVDRRNLPLNHKADAVIDATISEDCNPSDLPAVSDRGRKIQQLLGKSIDLGDHAHHDLPPSVRPIDWASCTHDARNVARKRGHEQ